MMGKRKRYAADFKAKVALEALRGGLTTAQLATKHGVHQTMVGEWKPQAVDGLAGVFSGKSAAQETARASEADIGIADGGRSASGETRFFGEGLRSMSVERRRQMMIWLRQTSG